MDLSQGPHVTALDNLGLCDVRTKPCRDVIVIAEQLATQSSDELKCIIEIYKVNMSLTVWKFQDFSVIQILREINFEESRRSKLAVFNISDALDFC